MDDIISHGRPPQRGWRGKAALAVVVAAVAALVVAEHAGHGHPARPPTGPAPAAPAPPSDSVVVAGPIQPWATTARMPRNGIAPAWFSIAGGAGRPIGGLPRYGAGYAFTRIEGGWLLQPGLGRPTTCGDCGGPASSAQAGCGNCPRPPTAVYYLADRARAVTTIGVATMIAPGSGAGLAWLTTFPVGSGLGTKPGLAREYYGTGAPRGPAISLPVGYEIVRATRRGLLLTAIAGRDGPRTDRLWDPASRRMVRTFDGVIAASYGALALADGRCAATCALRVLSLTTGRAATLRVPLGVPVAGSFSPDGRYLALEVGIRSATPTPGTQVDVAALASRQVLAVPRTRSSDTALDGFGWPDAADYLAVTVNSADSSVQLTYWDAASSAIAIAYLKAALDPRGLVAG